MDVDQDRLIIDHEVYTMQGQMLQHLFIKFINSFKLKAEYPNGYFSGILAIGDDMLVCGFNEYARLSVFKWDGKKYLECKRTLMKTIGDTKNLIVTKFKKSKYQKL